MTPLETTFERTLPALLKGKPRKPGVIGFAATGNPETGYWIVSLADGTSRRGTEKDRPEVVVEADAAVLVLLLAGDLDIPAALARGVLTVSGDRSRLTDLAALLAKA